MQKLDSGPEKGKLLVIGWGSTYGSIKTAVAELQKEGLAVSHAHLRYISHSRKIWDKSSVISNRY
ncbi:MAG: hypothetical protein WDM78_08680 [Puia sp.]